MATTNLVFIDAKYAEAAQTTQYTSTAPLTSVIDSFTATNESTSSATISLHIVPSGGSAAGSNKVVDERTIAAGETYTMPEVLGHVLKSGDYISTIASAASSIVIRASGRVIE